MWCPWAKLSSSDATGAQQGHAGGEPDAHAELKASAHVHSGVRLARYLNLEPGGALTSLNVENYADVTSFDRDNVLLFNAISEITNKRYIVDSSKHVLRLELLIRNQELDVFPIFLIREPEGQIWSCLRKNRKYAKLGKEHGRLVRTDEKIRGNQP